METLSDTIKTWIRGSSSSRRGQFLLTNLFDYLHETEAAAVKTRRAEEGNNEHGAEVTALHINNTVFEDIMHISSEIFHYPIYPVFI